MRRWLIIAIGIGIALSWLYWQGNAAEQAGMGPQKKKFGLDIRKEFGRHLDDLAGQGLLSLANGHVEVTREGLLQVDSLLPAFFDPEHRGARYT